MIENRSSVKSNGGFFLYDKIYEILSERKLKIIMSDLVIGKELKGTELIISLDGKLNTLTASDLEAELRQNIDGIETLILDMKNLEYISSSGLRVILKAEQIMSQNGQMIIRNVQKDVMDVFEVTGLNEDLNIED